MHSHRQSWLSTKDVFRLHHLLCLTTPLQVCGECSVFTTSATDQLRALVLAKSLGPSAPTRVVSLSRSEMARVTVGVRPQCTPLLQLTAGSVRGPPSEGDRIGADRTLPRLRSARTITGAAAQSAAVGCSRQTAGQLLRLPECRPLPAPAFDCRQARCKRPRHCSEQLRRRVIPV